MKKALIILQYILTIIMPLLLILSGIHLALTPTFVRLQYSLPGFPPDPFGFSKSERLQWAELSLDYLLGRLSHEQFAALRLPDGMPLYNQRELVHMLDVQVLTLAALNVWRALLIGAVLISFLIWAARHPQLFWEALRSGARLTLLLIALVIIAVFLNFNALFTAFHQVFFEGDSWLFRFDDTLIRLFPIFFWQMLFILVGAFTAIASGLLLLLSRILHRS